MESTPENSAGMPAFLGKQTPLPASPEEAQLDYVPNPRVGSLYMVRFAAPEFTSLCPVTGQPLAEEMKPQWLRIGGYWYPRGGIPIDVFWQTGAPPEGLWVPDQGVSGYRGRG